MVPSMLAMNVIVAIGLLFPIEISVCNESAFRFYGVLETHGQPSLLLAKATPVSRSPDRLALSVEMYSLEPGQMTALNAILDSSSISWNPPDYRLAPEEVQDRAPDCGFVRLGTRRVVACGIAEARTPAGAHIADILAELDRLKGVAVPLASDDRAREVLKVALVSVLDMVPKMSAREVDPQSEAAAVDALRTCISETLVNGELISDPLASPSVEVRMAAVSLYGARLPSRPAKDAVVRALNDSDLYVRVSAASELAPFVSAGDADLLVALQRLACDANAEPLNSHLRAILAGKSLLPSCAERVRQDQR